MNEETKTCAIVLNGEQLGRKIHEEFTICADGGANLLKDRLPDLIIGDGDSLNEVHNGVKVLSFPVQKNETDGELCVMYAAKHGYKSINIYGFLGGRADHMLGNYSLLALADRLGCNAVVREKNLDIYFAKNILEFDSKKNDIVSIIPFGQDIVVKNSEGLLYPLKNLEIKQHLAGMGISNLATQERVTLEIVKGEALVFHYFS